MCGTCESNRSRRWSGTPLILLAFVATLLVLSTAGVVAQIRSSAQRTAVERCAKATGATVSLQAAVTRDLRRHARLHADTRVFVRELRSLGAVECPETKRFLAAAEETVAGLCWDCVVELRRGRTNPA
ncbi:hypothetical protein BH09ACT13_BH09ACT13_03630 [soil metagenome]